jgi:hypothetical protein
MHKFALISILSLTALTPVAAPAQQATLPPYAQPDPNAARAPHPEPLPSRTAPPEDPAVTARARDWLHRAQTGDYDRSQLEAQMNKALTTDAVKQAEASLNALGKMTSFTYLDTVPAGNDLKTYVYRVAFPKATLDWQFTIDGSGKIAGLYLRPEEAPPDKASST